MSNEVLQQPSTDQIVITLQQHSALGLRVQAISLRIDGAKTRLDGHRNGTVEDVFKPVMAQHIRAICETATARRQIISVPDYCLRFRGLSIRGYTLLADTLDDGGRELIIRLERAVGNALAIFHPIGNPGSGLTMFNAHEEETSAHRIQSDRLFDEMLSHLYLPLVNLNSYLENVLDGQRAPCPELVTSSVLQFKTKAEVLQFAFDRLISETTPEAISPPADIQAQVADAAASSPQRRVPCTT